MLKKIKAEYKFHVQYLLGVALGGIFAFLDNFLRYHKYANSYKEHVYTIETREIFFIFFVSIFIAILFKNNFKFFLGVGASRKTIFTSTILNYISLAPIVALINIAIYKAFHNYQKFESIFLSIFKDRYQDINLSEKTVIIEYFIWQITVFLMVGLFFFIFALLLYKLNKKGKIICISFLAVLPFALFFIIGFVSQASGHSIVINAIKYIFGDSQYPMIASLTNIILATIFGFISYRIIRRMPLK